MSRYFVYIEGIIAGRKLKEVVLGHIIENTEMTERALLVGVSLSGGSREDAENSLHELARLADTAGAEVVGREIQYRKRPDAAYFIGKGKAEEIAQLYQDLGASSVILDADLSPAQTRNLEDLINGKIIDRTRLILDIFALHARTKEAMLEVELAQLAYLLPRLTRMWTHLSRQVSGAGTRSGGIGTRGPGEKQLDIDRRLVSVRMSSLKRSLDKIKNSRQLERRNREDSFAIALVGYTNAGKSSLLNVLANEDLYTDDRLFSTLDSTTRIAHLSENHSVMLTDTVGFIKKLPHHLIASFRATLEAVNDSRMLLHVVDVSQPDAQNQISAVNAVLEELGALGKPTIMVFNKIDKLEDMTNLVFLRREYPNSVEVSTLSGEGLVNLKDKLVEIISEDDVEIDIQVSQKDGRIINYVYEHGRVTNREFNGNLVRVRAMMNRKHADRLEKLTEPVS